MMGFNCKIVIRTPQMLIFKWCFPWRGRRHYWSSLMSWLCRRRIAFEERWLVAYHVFISHNNHTTLIHVFSQGSWCSLCLTRITNTKSVFYDRIDCIILSIKEITYHFLEAKKKNRRKPSKNQSIPEKLGENTVLFVAMAYLLTFCWVVRGFFSRRDTQWRFGWRHWW